ncbi:CDP-diglyceride synthetase [Campylobacter blaseri]|uniref:Phosphatidate cytidylyltransferase n=1 Tax=Campylobacter blaseri TaxID=2042961 RepID=A0A2P8R406_9BACT|nr:phosphatidate cytidylyltransferase [Campylobacter blaseri]PSM53203.1 phosphatidate cytidylyltransferase [Campylobacter blaseri]PSM54669.1 phosphatidate cytidylyltransferase [Campylobacter blaseri]QKF86854.1 CDP-diglyceride synthetase [Campylobacter blaseri]
MEARLKTAGIMILALLVLVFLDIWLLNVLVFAAILAIAFSESLLLFKVEKWELIIVAMVSFVLFLPFAGSFEGTYKFIMFLILFIASYLALMNRQNWESILPFLYPVAPIFIMFSIYNTLGISCLVFVIAIVVATDSGAYFIGKMFGRYRFTPTSPNKTIEGVLGGILCGVVLGFLYNKNFIDGNVFSIWSIILISISSVFGDLFESYLKRKAGVKDSGTLFPGHGGVLDRVDGLLFASMVLSLVVTW